jgi:hypothetical protein
VFRWLKPLGEIETRHCAGQVLAWSFTKSQFQQISIIGDFGGEKQNLLFLTFSLGSGGVFFFFCFLVVAVVVVVVVVAAAVVVVVVVVVEVVYMIYYCYSEVLVGIYT